MNVSRYIANHYFFSPYRKGFINLVTLLSVIILVGAVMAMVVVLSVFNGFSDRLRSIHQSFDPQVQVVPVNGKTFAVSDSLLNAVLQIEGVDVITEVIEDDVYLQYNGLQKLARFKGVSSNYAQQNDISNCLVRGETILTKDSIDYAVLGRGVLHDLNISIGDYFHPIQFTYPKRKKKITGKKSINTIPLVAGGVFEIERQYDDRFVFISLPQAEKLTDNFGRRTSLDIHTKGKINAVIKKLQTALGTQFDVLSGDRQHESLYKAIKIEKFIAFLVLIIILAVASVNLYIVVTMMIVSKKKDIEVLYSFGATKRMIQKVFFYEGLNIAVLGTFLGLVLGGLVCYLQDRYGLVGMGVSSAISESFPVLIKASDFVSVGVTALLVCVGIIVTPIFNIKDIKINQ